MKTQTVYIRYRTSGSVFNLRRLLSQTKVSSSLPRELLYADDCDIVAHSEDELQCFMNHFISAVDGNKLDVVHSFVYLGSTLSEGCSLDREISFRIERAYRSFSALNKRVWSQHGIKLHTKSIVCKLCVSMALLYASETWTLYKHQSKLLSINGAWDRYFISNGSPMFQIQKY